MERKEKENGALMFYPFARHDPQTKLVLIWCLSYTRSAPTLKQPLAVWDLLRVIVRIQV